MRYMTGDIWQLASDLDGWVVVPTNTQVRKDGAAVMGKGMAKDASDKFSGLSESLGRHIQRFGDTIYVSRPIICLPTKRDWRHPSRMEYIEKGCREIVELSRILNSVQHTQPILLPKLGCGLGGLNWERQVRPVVDAILESDRFVLVTQ